MIILRFKVLHCLIFECSWWSCGVGTGKSLTSFDNIVMSDAGINVSGAITGTTFSGSFLVQVLPLAFNQKDPQLVQQLQPSTLSLLMLPLEWMI